MAVLINEPPHADIYCYFPQNFFHKSVNEPFIQKIMSIVLERKNWTHGNPDLLEPDYFCDGDPFEFTIASDKKKKNNFVQKYQVGRYSSEDVETDIFGYINVALKSKAQKKYSASGVHLCVLCPVDRTSWILDKCGSVTYCIFDSKRKEFFSEIKQNYIENGLFKNIFIIFPDMYARWWIWDVLTNAKSSIQLSPSQIMNKKLPFILEQNIFDKFSKKIW